MIIDLLRYVKRFFLYPVRNLKVFKFSFHRYPQNAYYPCHIKNYDDKQQFLAKQYENSEKMVIFFNVMIYDAITGGMLSINNFVEKSKQLSFKYNFNLVLAGIPINYAIIPSKYFDYALEPIDFNYILKYTKPKKLLLHIPEDLIKSFLNDLSAKHIEWLKNIGELSINILNQNDELMPSQIYIEQIRKICDNNLTITTAHQRYCTEEKSIQYGSPVFLLQPFSGKYYKSNLQNKENIIILSPDLSQYKDKVIKKLKKELPDYKLQIIKNMKFEDYKKVISKAKYAITFGEGMDGYFSEPYMSGSIGFAVHNNTFFPKDFIAIPTVYKSWEDLYEKIVDDIRSFDKNPLKYEEISKIVEDYFLGYIQNNTSMDNLENLYKRWLKD